MTQFALAITKDDSPSLVSVERLRDDFLIGIAKSYFLRCLLARFFSLEKDGKNIDQLMLDAQKTAGSLQFEKTELCQIIRRIAPTVEELVFWYGSDYDDLDCIYDVSTLISKLREATSESVCEAYVHYKQLRSDK